MASWSRNQRSIVRSKRVSTSVGAKVTFWYLAADAPADQIGGAIGWCLGGTASAGGGQHTLEEA